MVIKNLLLKFDKEQTGKFIFLTDNNFEVVIPADVFPPDFDRQKSFYLAMDLLPLLSSAENKKILLNELLNPDDK
jgi:hypothetical protein